MEGPARSRARKRKQWRAQLSAWAARSNGLMMDPQKREPPPKSVRPFLPHHSFALSGTSLRQGQAVHLGSFSKRAIRPCDPAAIRADRAQRLGKEAVEKSGRDNTTALVIEIV